MENADDLQNNLESAAAKLRKKKKDDFMIDDPYYYLYGVLMIKFRHESTDPFEKTPRTFLSVKNKNHVYHFR